LGLKVEGEKPLPATTVVSGGGGSGGVEVKKRKREKKVKESKEQMKEPKVKREGESLDPSASSDAPSRFEGKTEKGTPQGVGRPRLL